MDAPDTPAEMAALVERAARGAALLAGEMRPTLARVAEMLGVQRSQVTRWCRGDAQPRVLYRRGLAILANLDATLWAARRETESELRQQGFMEDEMVRLNAFDGWTFDELARCNNLLATGEFEARVRRRRARRQCDLCGTSMPRASRPAGEKGPPRQFHVLRHVTRVATEPAIGAFACATCRTEMGDR